MYFCNATIRIARYMVDDDEIRTVFHAISATSYDEAHEKIYSFYEAKDADYDVMHMIENIEWAVNIE